MGMMFFGSSTTGGGFNFNGGYSDGGGSPGGTNGGSAGGEGGGTLPLGSPGSLLRYNGDAWVTITPPPGLKQSVVVNTATSAGGSNYIQGNQPGGIIYFNGLLWDYLDGTTIGERVLIMRNGQPEWLDAPALGTKVLGSVAGVVQWLDTESCDL
jgi:hypothetical protein